MVSLPMDGGMLSPIRASSISGGDTETTPTKPRLLKETVSMHEYQLSPRILEGDFRAAQKEHSPMKIRIRKDPPPPLDLSLSTNSSSPSPDIHSSPPTPDLNSYSLTSLTLHPSSSQPSLSQPESEYSPSHESSSGDSSSSFLGSETQSNRRNKPGRLSPIPPNVPNQSYEQLTPSSTSGLGLGLLHVSFVKEEDPRSMLSVSPGERNRPRSRSISSNVVGPIKRSTSPSPLSNITNSPSATSQLTSLTSTPWARKISGKLRGRKSTPDLRSKSAWDGEPMPKVPSVRATSHALSPPTTTTSTTGKRIGKLKRGFSFSTDGPNLPSVPFQNNPSHRPSISPSPSSFTTSTIHISTSSSSKLPKLSKDRSTPPTCSSPLPPPLDPFAADAPFIPSPPRPIIPAGHAPAEGTNQNKKGAVFPHHPPRSRSHSGASRRTSSPMGRDKNNEEEAKKNLDKQKDEGGFRKPRAPWLIDEFPKVIPSSSASSTCSSSSSAPGNESIQKEGEKQVYGRPASPSSGNISAASQESLMEGMEGLWLEKEGEPQFFSSWYNTQIETQQTLSSLPSSRTLRPAPSPVIDPSEDRPSSGSPSSKDRVLPPYASPPATAAVHTTITLGAPLQEEARYSTLFGSYNSFKSCTGDDTGRESFEFAQDGGESERGRGRARVEPVGTEGKHEEYIGNNIPVGPNRTTDAGQGLQKGGGGGGDDGDEDDGDRRGRRPMRGDENEATPEEEEEDGEDNEEDEGDSDSSSDDGCESATEGLENPSACPNERSKDREGDEDDDVPLALAHPSTALKAQKSLRLRRKKEKLDRRIREKKAAASAAGGNDVNVGRGEVHEAELDKGNFNGKERRGVISPPTRKRRERRVADARHKIREQVEKDLSSAHGVIGMDGVLIAEELEKRLLALNLSATQTQAWAGESLLTGGSHSAVRSRKSSASGPSSSGLASESAVQPAGSGSSMLPLSEMGVLNLGPVPMEATRSLPVATGYSRGDSSSSRDPFSTTSTTTAAATSITTAHQSNPPAGTHPLGRAKSTKEPSRAERSGTIRQNRHTGLASPSQPVAPVIRRRPSEPQLHSSEGQRAMNGEMKPPSVPPLPYLPGASVNFSTYNVHTPPPHAVTMSSPVNGSFSDKVSPRVRSRRPTISTNISPSTVPDHARTLPSPIVIKRMRFHFEQIGGKSVDVDLTETTTAGVVLNSLRKSGDLDVGRKGEELLKGGWAVWESGKDWGIERPIREYEQLLSIASSWNEITKLNAFVIKRCLMSGQLNINNIPGQRPNIIGSCKLWQCKKNKWSKRFVEIRDGVVWVCKNDRGKDEQYLCALSAFDIYTLTKPIPKAPSGRIWCLKSQDKAAFFEDPADYMHLFVCDERAFDSIHRRTFSARSQALTVSNPALFSTRSTSGSPGAPSPSATVPTSTYPNPHAHTHRQGQGSHHRPSSPALALVSSSALASSAQTSVGPSGAGTVGQGKSLWEKGSLLSKLSGK
ncbi:hypothetical protein [Phaffia rhodozyma]|uniref:PH domain-containing protein n=1 Tax=Phaffia rhodozyma TaxID=264483 RepID=A0A0F7SQL1_PHARH|nr:hypothetical protein [Phaffia rhodozyma]